MPRTGANFPIDFGLGKIIVSNPIHYSFYRNVLPSTASKLFLVNWQYAKVEV